MEVIINNVNHLADCRFCGRVTDPNELIDVGGQIVSATVKALGGSDHPTEDLEIHLCVCSTPVSHLELKPEDGLEFTDAGYIYLKGTINEFRHQWDNHERLVLLLNSEPSNHGCLIQVNVRSFGYGYRDFGDQISYDQEGLFLLATPNPVEPGDWEQVSLVREECLSTISFFLGEDHAD